MKTIIINKRNHQISCKATPSDSEADHEDDTGAGGLYSASEKETKEIQEIEIMANEAKQRGTSFIPMSAGKADYDKVENLVSYYIDRDMMQDTIRNRSAVKATLGILCQEGATSPKYSETRSCNMFGIQISVKEMREDVKKLGIGTVRRLARTISKHAMKGAELYSILGNQHKQYLMEFPDASEEELRYASDFNTFSDDPAIPENVRAWLLKNYHERFAKK